MVKIIFKTMVLYYIATVIIVSFLSYYNNDFNLKEILQFRWFAWPIEIGITLLG